MHGECGFFSSPKKRSTVHHSGTNLPSGNLLRSELENGPVEIVDLPMKHGGSFQFATCKRLPDGNVVNHGTLW